jgi:hypothetical protein
MPLTYANYVAYAQTKGFQPVSVTTFNALVLAGYNPITNTWRGRSFAASGR